jgi:hypothetical protein
VLARRLHGEVLEDAVRRRHGEEDPVGFVVVGQGLASRRLHALDEFGERERHGEADPPAFLVAFGDAGDGQRLLEAHRAAEDRPRDQLASGDHAGHAEKEEAGPRGEADALDQVVLLAGVGEVGEFPVGEEFRQRPAEGVAEGGLAVGDMAEVGIALLRRRDDPLPELLRFLVHRARTLRGSARTSRVRTPIAQKHIGWR